MTQVKYSFNKNHNVHAFLYTYHSTSMQMNLHTYEFVGVIIWMTLWIPHIISYFKKIKNIKFIKYILQKHKLEFIWASQVVVIQIDQSIYCKSTSWNS